LSPQNWHVLGTSLRYAVALGAMFYVTRQVRKPDRWGGRFFLSVMNKSHSGVTDWGLEHVRVESDDTILDVGCGGGRTIEKLAALAPAGKVFGVDYASGSVNASRARNAQLIAAGRVAILEGSVSQVPFPEGQFDLVTAVETQYYWPNLPQDMREILRVLKPGGTLIVIAESYKGRGFFSKLQQAGMKLLRVTNMGVEDQRVLFSGAGYEDIQIFEETRKGWLCAVGTKPS
jgi:SAM-dependent methyltransferase